MDVGKHSNYCRIGAFKVKVSRWRERKGIWNGLSALLKFYMNDELSQSAWPKFDQILFLTCSTFKPIHVCRHHKLVRSP